MWPARIQIVTAYARMCQTLLLLCFLVFQSAGPQKESKQDKKGKKKKKKVFDTTLSSNPKLKYRQKDGAKGSSVIAEQSRKQQGPIIVAVGGVGLGKESGAGIMGEEEGLAAVKEEEGEGLREEGEGEEVEGLGAGTMGEGEEEEAVEKGVYRMKVTEKAEGVPHVELTDGAEGVSHVGVGWGSRVGVSDNLEGESRVEVTDNAEGMSNVDVAGGEEVDVAAVESDEEEKRALLAEENIRQLEEAEKVVLRK